MNGTRNRSLGSLIGGAAGDALGYAVEFFCEDQIFRSFGPNGITQYVVNDGAARISDDTQMTLFTANGLLLAAASAEDQRNMDRYLQGIAYAYRQWYRTQMYGPSKAHSTASDCWLMEKPGLYVARAPGNTCMSAIALGCHGSIDHPINHSKGCGGVMRVAPIGLLFPWNEHSVLDVDRLGAATAALTHGHEMGYIPAAMLVHMIQMLSHGVVDSIYEATTKAMDAMQTLFPHAVHLPAFLKLMQCALHLAESKISDLDAIHQLGEGWVGDEALAIAVYCAVKYADDFDRALIASVNHQGDSDSTGAITGNILGARLGLDGIPQKYIENLELLDVITQIGEDLNACRNFYSQVDAGADDTWREKYLGRSWING